MAQTQCVACFAIVLQVSVCGCGPPKPDRAPIQGEITYQGNPVPFGEIVFEPKDGWDGFYAQADIIDGKYQLSDTGAVVGLNRVEIHGYKSTGKVAPDISGKRPDEPPKLIAVTEPYLPPKYNLASELTVVVKEGANDGVDFHLE